jgi:H+/Cl- antiporter ClcA
MQGFLIQALFTAHAGAFALHVLFAYSGMYWVLAAVTYGAFIPSGLFTPSLIFGGCLGRIYADLLVGAIAGTGQHLHSLRSQVHCTGPQLPGAGTASCMPWQQLQLH